MSQYEIEDESTCFKFLPAHTGHYVEDGIVLCDIGWAWASIYGVNGSEFVFAFGWHKEGSALDALKKVSRNHLLGWSEARTTFYEQWYPSNLYEMQSDDQPAYCWKTFTTTPNPIHDGPLSIRPIDVTIFRHNGWVLDSELKRSCARFKGWYQGNRKRIVQNPAALMLQPCDLHNLPGYALYGRLDGSRERLLEWPTHDYQWLKERASIWASRGACKIHFSKDGWAFYIEEHGWIDRKTDALITRAIKHYGDDFAIMDVLQFGIS